MSSEQTIAASQPIETPPAVENSAAVETAMPMSQPTTTPHSDGHAISSIQDESPFAEQGVSANVRAANMYGACSIEDFCHAGDLSYTHDDAHGWVDYVNNYTAENFWRGDGDVKIWLYTEPYDNWQNTYGVDAVRAFYHSGHGAMDSNGVFYAPLGGSWDGTHNDHTVYSTQMQFANEAPGVRYIFWSTCFSLRVLEGHSPIRTWGPDRIGGLRMLFGFETVSWDNPNYGKFFWEEWNRPKPLSTAWLDASWRIAHDQAPSVVAFGANSEEARDRLYNERYLYDGAVAKNWYQWRWYYASTATNAIRDPQRALPQALVAAQLRPVTVSAETVSQVAQQFGLDVRPDRQLKATRAGTVAAADGDVRVAIDRNGTVSVRLAQPNHANRSQLPLQQARSIAEDAVRRYGLSQDANLTFDRVRIEAEAGGTDQGSGQREGPFVTQTTIQYRQVINELPVLTPDAGVVRVTVDNDGKVTAVETAVRSIDRLSDQASGILAPPPPGRETGTSANGQPRATDEAGYRQLLAQEWGKQLAARAVRGKMPLGYTVVPTSTEVGYAIRGNTAVVAARQAIEVDFGNGIYKRYWIETDL